MNPLISIIVPNYNNSKYIETCLNSIIRQTYENIEVIVVDDCSTDNSVEIINKIKKYENRINLIINKKNLKVSRTRDIGIKKSRAEWVTTLDSDDVYISDRKLEKEIIVLEKMRYRKSVIAYSGIVIINKKGKKIKKVMNDTNKIEGYIYEKIMTRSCAIPRDFIFSKYLYYKIGGYNVNIPIYEDWDLKIRLAKEAEFVFSGIDGIGYRKHNNGLSSVNKKEHRKWILNVFDRNVGDNKKKEELRKILIRNINTKIYNVLFNKTSGKCN